MLMPWVPRPTPRFAALNVGLTMCNVFDVNYCSIPPRLHRRGDASVASLREEGDKGEKAKRPERATRMREGEKGGKEMGRKVWQETRASRLYGEGDKGDIGNVSHVV